MTELALVPELRPWPEGIVATKDGYPVPELGILPRVTHIIDSTVGLWSQFLNMWYARTEREAVLGAVAQQFEWGKGMSSEAFVGMVESGIGKAKAAQRAKEKAGDIGTAVHAMIQWRLRGELAAAEGVPFGEAPPRLGDEATLAYMAWDDWWKQAGIRPIRVEQVLWSKQWGYAGQIDLFGEDSEGPGLWDWKSSNYILAKHHIQVAAYLEMLNDWRPCTRAHIVRLPKSLKDVSIEIQPLGHYKNPDLDKFETRTHQDMFAAFLAARTLYRVFMERP